LDVLNVAVEACDHAVMRRYRHGLRGRRDRREDKRRERGGDCSFGHREILPFWRLRKSVFDSPEWRTFAPEVKAPAPLVWDRCNLNLLPMEKDARYRHISHQVPAASVIIVSGAPTLK
jgi:hypothetical protein